ncbi:TonB-dependent receptor [Arundinibacter roseus]|uniref:TonB-dependent receptor n=1 Tax=Arundinibacter roseus TaxID=2070510 RepID=A0A4R4KBV3_9BACT|nr:TonB-dependent receptor [Arundinibacter roseus]TDB65083.1 TonB-dependent receptor [Arundinibacter roseus]
MFRALLLSLCLSLPAMAQEGTRLISGKITTTASDKPLSDVTVQILNSNLGTRSAADGSFQLRVSRSGIYQLRFSSVGFSAVEQTVQVDNAPVVVDISLTPALIQLNDQVVVTAQRYETPDFERPEALTVISKRDLSGNSMRSTPEILMGQSGVFLQKTNHGGGSPFVRGLTGQQTLLLVDGIRLNNATFRSGPNQYLNTIDPFLLDRIEIARGAGSVQYGSDAIGGAINVLTASPDYSDKTEFHGTVLGKLMSGGMEKSGRLSASVTAPNVGIQGGFSYRSFGDLIGGAGIGTQVPTGYDQYSLDLKSRIKLTPNVQLTLSVQHMRQDSVPVFHKVQLENFAVNQFNPQIRTLAYARLEGQKATKWASSWQLTALAGRTVEERQSRKNSAVRTLHEKDEVQTVGALASIISRPTRLWTIQSGIEWYYDYIGSMKQEIEPIFSSAGPQPIQRGLYPDHANMSNLAFYNLHTIQLQKLLVTVGGRFNTFSISIPDKDLGNSTISPSAWVGNAGISYELLPFLRVIAQANTSFRAPNIDDLGTLGIVDFRYEVPNTDLRPERGFNKEVGLKIKLPGFSSSVFVYHNQLTDLIGRVKTAEIRQDYPVYLKENISKAFIRGLEADAEFQLASDLLLSGFLNYTYGQNLSGNEPYRRIPPLNGRMSLRYQPTRQSWLSLDYLTAATQDRLAKGDVDDNRIPEGGTPGWNVFNLSAGYQIGKISLTASAQNLLNEAYKTHGSGVSEVGRSVWLMARFDW